MKPCGVFAVGEGCAVCNARSVPPPLCARVAAASGGGFPSALARRGGAAPVLRPSGLARRFPPAPLRPRGPLVGPPRGRCGGPLRCSPPPPLAPVPRLPRSGPCPARARGWRLLGAAVRPRCPASCSRARPPAFSAAGGLRPWRRSLRRGAVFAPSPSPPPASASCGVSCAPAPFARSAAFALRPRRVAEITRAAHTCSVLLWRVRCHSKIRDRTKFQNFSRFARF